VRLDLGHLVTEWLDPQDFVPAPGQGAIAIQALVMRLEEDLDWIESVDDCTTRQCVTAERECMAAVEGGCRVPLGVLVRVEGDDLRGDAYMSSLDGRDSFRASLTGPRSWPQKLGQELARVLLEAGAARVRGEPRT